MLKALRHKGTQKKIYIFLAVIIVVSFVVTGVQIGHEDQRSSGGALATIGKHPVTVQEYLDSYRAVQRQASFMYGDKLNEVRDRINFKGEAWDRLLLLDHARRNKIRATDQDVVKWLTTQTAFQSKGRFDEKLYELYVERGMRSTPRAFEEEMRQMLTIGKAQESLKASLALPEDKLKELYQKERTEKDILYALVTWESQKDKVPVMDKETEQLYSMMKDKMTDKDGKPMTPEQTLAEVKSQIAKQPATELAVKKLTELKEKMKGADFEAVLKAEGVTVTPVEKYRAGMYPGGIFPSEALHEAVEKLDAGGISEVLQVPPGAMLVKVTKVHPFDGTKFDQEKEAFAKETADKAFGKNMNELMETLRKDLKLNLEKMKEIFPEDAKTP